MPGVIDIHIHIGGPGDSGSGCRMSNQFIFSPAFAAMLIALKASPFDLRDEKIKEIILDAITTSKKIDYAVLLALDGVYKNGKYIESESHLVTPNEYIIDISKTKKRVLFGASIHPYRKKKEVLYETKKCIDNGAVLFKWIPSSQQIDPEDKRCITFYKALAKENVPLLCHTGGELAVPTSDFTTNKFNDPRRLKKALTIGVKVIAAHCATPYLGGILPVDKDYFEELLEMLRVSEKKKWNLYADISAFCTPTRITYLERINEEISKGTLNPRRFLYGSDFPIPIVDITIFKNLLNLHELLEHIKKLGNPLDNNYTILKEFGIHDSIFTNAWDVLRLSNQL
ncbi:MAG: amidohydrolase family protein [Nitrospirota bacterium]|nr:amidohydrolase family protein [Nitrospirota bacterium]